MRSSLCIIALLLITQLFVAGHASYAPANNQETDPLFGKTDDEAGTPKKNIARRFWESAKKKILGESIEDGFSLRAQWNRFNSFLRRRVNPLNFIFFRPPPLSHEQFLKTRIKKFRILKKSYNDQSWWNELGRRNHVYFENKFGTFAPDQDCASKPFAILFFGGNAMNLIHNIRATSEFRGSDYCRVIVEHPGYGFSRNANGWKGPNEIDVLAVARSSLFAVMNEYGFKPSQIYVMGFSIGTGAAVDIAHGVSQMNTAHPTFPQLRLLVLLAPYTSTRDLVRERVGVFANLFFNHFNNLAKIRQVTTPTLYAHGIHDTLIPLSHSERLYDAQPGNVEKKLKKLNGAHNFDREIVHQEMIQFFDKSEDQGSDSDSSPVDQPSSPLPPLHERTGNGRLVKMVRSNSEDDATVLQKVKADILARKAKESNPGSP
jgi:fermentation-respiration switch protein FrsA (DUF1100 family)